MEQNRDARGMNKVIVLVFVVLLAGCAKESHVRMEIDESVAARIGRENSCPEAPEGSCAIDSWFHELADRAFADSVPEAPQHYAIILDYGQDALLARLHLIRSAKKSIRLQTYIWDNDEVGRLLFFELLKAARRGVKVRLIVDQITVAEEPGVLARLATAHENLEISFYNPTFSRGKITPLRMTAGALFSFRKINQRMHNKVMIIDDRIGIVGGRNIGNSYYDYSPVYNFKDRDVIIIGPAVMELGESFEQYWNHEVVVNAVYLVDVGEEIVGQAKSGQPTFLDEPDFSLFSDIDLHANRSTIFEDRPVPRPFSVGRVQFIADLPGKKSGDLLQTHGAGFETIGELVMDARNSITIQTPYFFLSRTAYKTLKHLRDLNPELELTVSTNSLAATDLFTTYAIMFKQKRKMIKNLEINLFEFKPFPGDAREYIKRYDQLTEFSDGELQHNTQDQSGLVPTESNLPRFGLHGKSFVIDSKIAIIGSHNLNPRSQNLNTEVVAVIWDEKVAHALEHNILLDTEPRNSWVVAKQEQVPVLSFFSNAIGTVSSMLPVFDIWPFRYSSSFQLKGGMDPVPADHSDFYKHYEDVGQFPEVQLSGKAVKARLIKAFGGFAAPIM